MENSRTVFLDERIGFHAYFPNSHNRLVKVGLLILTSLIIAANCSLLKKNFPLVAGCCLPVSVAFLLVILLQPLFHKYFGRRYLQVSEEGLLIRNSCFREPFHLPWSSIRQISFSGERFILSLHEETKRTIRVRTHYKYILDTRLALRDFARRTGVSVVERSRF